jgi:hypothetical protein
LTVPKLKGIDYLGWDAWLKRLLAVAFMAPTFMFFLLLISKIIQAEVFKDMTSKDLGLGGAVMLIVIPAIIYLSLLWKATEFAKKGGRANGRKREECADKQAAQGGRRGWRVHITTTWGRYEASGLVGVVGLLSRCGGIYEL